MALDPNIALGYKPIQLEQRNPLAEYAQIQNIQTGQLQNQLARQQMEQEQGVINYLSSANLGTPEGISGLNKFGKTGLGYAKLIAEQEANALKNKEMQGKLREQQMSALGTGLTSVMNDPTDEKLGQAFDRLDATGVDTKKLRDQFGKLTDLPSRIAGINAYVMSHPEGRAALAFVQPKPEKYDLNGKIVTLDMNPNSPTYKQPIQEFTKTQTFADRNAAARLNLEREKFNFEKANPGYEFKEDADGNFFGVNKRTLQAVPVTVGGGAPAAAPAVSGAGMPGPRMAQPNVVPAIPGMTSVLDQTMPAAAPAAAPVAGGPRQLVGKGTAMTENQSKSAMFGAAMNQANNIISKVEKEGTTTAPVAVSVLQGLARLSPQFLGTGENAANSIESVFRQDPTSLLGPDVNQQKLGQAQIAFATAYLRATSGASFGPSEVSNTIKEYFPLIGEDKAVVKQKAEARQRAIEGMKISTSKQGQSYIDQSGANANDPLGILGGKR
jgi:hypothetical protein